MFTRIVTRAITLLIACIAAVVPTATASAATKGTAVKIGVVLPLSGSTATAGLASEHGAQLAVSQANSSKLVPNVSFSLVSRSDTGPAGTPDGQTGATATKGLIADGQVAGLVAPSDTAAALGELPLANRAPLATVSPSATDTCLTIAAALGCTGSADELGTVQPTGRTTFFRVAPSDALQGAALADFLQGRGYHRAYVIDDGSPSGTAQATTFIDRWQRDSETVLGHASVAPATDYVNLLTQIAALRPDVVVYTGASEAEGTALLQQKQVVPGLHPTPFAATASVHTAAFLQAAGIPGGPVWAVAPEPELSQLPSATSFAGQYQTKFGAATTDAARGYDSARSLLLAVKAAIAGGAKPPATTGASAGAFRRAVIAALARLTFTGADGPIAFAANGDLQQGPVEVDQLRPVSPDNAWVPAGIEQEADPPATATLTPSPLDFGRASTQGSSQLTVQLANTGVIPFGVGSVSVSGAAFTLAGTTCTTAQLVPAAHCAITIRFAPGGAGTFTGKVTVTDIAGRTLQTGALSGTGVTAVALPAAVYVGNGANSTVRSFALPLGADHAPATTLAGSSTQLDAPAAVALDTVGYLYVANEDDERITIYRGDATGNAAPSAVLSGPNTGLAEPVALALDAQGRLYVANAAAGTVTVYAPGANGDAAPIRTISGLSSPDGLAVDATGNLWVANAATNSLMRFGPADAKPAATISGPHTGLDGPQSLALSPSGDVLVADEYSSEITAYAAGDNGDAAPSFMIAGGATGLDFPVGLDVDAAGNLYVSNLFANTITVYGASARGNAAPTETLSGATTGLAAPEHLAVSPPLAIITHRLGAAHVHRRYRARLIATFGVKGYRWAIERGRLPRGMRLSRRTGLLTGIPVRRGRFRVRVKVTDHGHPVAVASGWVTLTVRGATARR